MRVKHLAFVMAALVLLAAPAAVGARSATAEARLAHERVLAYWTPERVANAQWKGFERQSSGKFVPVAKPGGGAVTGASWTGNGIIERQSGRVLFHQGNGDWICSASIVNSSATTGHSVVLTAGHCIYDSNGGWATEWLFIPSFDDNRTYDCPLTTYGCWSATHLAVHDTFFDEGGFGSEASVEVDYGFARVGPGGHAGNVDLDSLGAYALKTTSTALSVQQWAFGYPAAGRYKGYDLTYCTNSNGTSLINDPYGANTWGMACNMTGGSSGGPWVTGTTNPGTSEGDASSVNSYGYSGLTYMFGPKFNTATSTVLGDAADTSQTSGTSVVHLVGTP